MAKAIEVIGEFDYERHVFGRGDARTIIGTLEDGTVVKGRAAEGRLETGMPYRFYGHWTEHPKYGKQFAFQSFTLVQPSGERGTIQYLQRGPGIGRKRAVAIWAAFGEEALEVVRTQPGRVAEAVGLPEGKAIEAAAYFAALAGLEKVTIELADLLGNRGFPRTLAEALLGEFGNDAPNVVKSNPYILMRFRGVGFLRADQLYLELGHPADAITRQAYCIHHAIASDQEGHTWHPATVAADAIQQNVDGAAIDPEAAIAHGIAEGLIVYTELYSGRWIADAAKAGQEAKLAALLVEAALEGASTRWPDATSIQGIDGQQPEELAKATAGVLGVLAGRPGTGKTHTLAAMIRAMGAGRIAVCCPTGKAAVKATESLARNGLAMQATTIHRLLGVESVDGGFRFKHDRDCRLPMDFIIVDEFSMCDVPLTASLLDARPAGCHVLFVGDPDQLSPVGHGAPLRDMMAAGVPYGLLTEIRRNSGQIVRTCKAIAEKKRFPVSKALDPKAGENLVVIDAGTPERQIAILKTTLERIQAAGRWNVFDDVQILVAVNAKSPLGRKALNKELQGFLNPNGEKAEPNPFRVGDKVINQTNSFLPAEDDGQPGADGEGRLYCANGELARVVAVAPLFTVVKLANPDRLVRIPRGTVKEGEGEDASDTGCSWELGYAISTHKSQGSEWPIILLMLDSYPGAIRLVDRHWVYTAISRAREMCICIGKASIAERAVLRSAMWKRKTFLRELIESLTDANLATGWESDLLEAAK